MATGSVECDLPWQGDVTITPTGDLLLALDSPQTAAATTQRLIRLLLTTPTLNDQFGVVVAPPDDLFHPTYGAGLRASVDGAYSEANIAALRALILDGLASDSAITTDPPPAVSITTDVSNPYVANIAITVTTLAGQTIPLPTLQITSDGT